MTEPVIEYVKAPEVREGQGLMIVVGSQLQERRVYFLPYSKRAAADEILSGAWNGDVETTVAVLTENAFDSVIDFVEDYANGCTVIDKRQS